MRTLTSIQKKLLEMLEWYHSFCEENNLRYFAIGGTMLGAARHQGFIPWDDDVDIGMPRSDYEKFVDMTRGGINEHYITETYRDGNYDFTYSFAKLYDTDTTLIEHRRHIVKRGLYLDIYPIDGAGDTLRDSRVFFKPIGKRLNIVTARVSAIRKGRLPMKNLAVLLAGLIPEKIFSIQKEIEYIDGLCKSRDYDSHLYVGNLYGLKRAGEIVPKEFLGTPTLYKFEHIEIFGVEQFDKYLSAIYGEWRLLPPKEKQITHHDYIECILDKPYVIY